MATTIPMQNTMQTMMSAVVTLSLLGTSLISTEWFPLVVSTIRRLIPAESALRFADP